MNKRIVFTNPDGSCGVITPTGKVTIAEVTRLDVPRLVLIDITFPDNSVIAAGTLIKIIDFYHEAMIIQKLPVVDVADIELNNLEQLPNRQITTAELPADRLFRNAWDDRNPENYIGLDLVKAKVIAHDIRRADRDVKMEPLDKETAFISTTPSRKAAIDIEKQAVLAANATVQVNIDAALDESALRAVLNML